MSEDWSVSEEDYEDAGPSKSEPPPVGKYTFKIEEPKLGKDKNGNPFYGLRLRVENGPQANRVVFDNYSPWVKPEDRKRVSKSTGKEYVDPNWRRTLSLLAALGHQNGRPPGFPGSDVKIEDLNGTTVDAVIFHEYEDVPGEEYPVASWSKKFKELKASGALDGIVPTARVNAYELSDDFEGVGVSGGADDDGEEWGA
mgnify:FL=1